MPIDKDMADAILGTFRGMARSLKEANNESDAAKQCQDCMAKMEKLALEMDDLGAFSTKLSVDGLFTDFSTSYGRALASTQSKVNSDSSDAQLMANTLRAYEDALNVLKENPSNAHIVPVVAKVVEMGKSGLSYPLFLKECEQQGIFLGLDSPHAGPSIKYDIYCCEVGFRPLDKEMYAKQLEAFEKMADRSAFGYPDPVEWEVSRQKIEWDFAPRQARWKAIEDRWDRMLGMVHDWVDSFCSFAPFDERWVDQGGNQAATLKNIARTQECTPGELQVREEIFNEYFNLTWTDIFSHETFINQVNARMLWFSDEMIEFIKEIRPVMKPGAKPTGAMIGKAEAIHNSKSYMRNDRITADEMKIMPFVDFLKTL